MPSLHLGDFPGVDEAVDWGGGNVFDVLCVVVVRVCGRDDAEAGADGDTETLSVVPEEVEAVVEGLRGKPTVAVVVREVELCSLALLADTIAHLGPKSCRFLISITCSASLSSNVSKLLVSRV